MYRSQVRGRPDAGADRHHASPEAFAERHQVGSHAVVLAAEHLAAAPHPALDLVEDEESAVLVADLARRREVARRRDVDAALALDRLDDDRGHAISREIARGHDHAQRVDVSEGHVRPALQGQEGLPEHRFRRPGERAEGLAVERSDRSDEVMPARGQHRHLEAGLDRLRARVGEEGVLQVSGRDERDQPREVRAQRVDQLLRMDGLPLELLLDRLEDLRMPVARDVDPEPSEHVDELFAPDVPKHRSVVFPLHGRVVGRDGLAVLQEARVDVVRPVAHGVLDHLVLLRRREGLLADEIEDVRGLLARAGQVLGHGLCLLSSEGVGRDSHGRRIIQNGRCGPVAG